MPLYLHSNTKYPVYSILMLSVAFDSTVTAHEEVGSAETRARIEELEREKETLMSELDQLRQGG